MNAKTVRIAPADPTDPAFSRLHERHGVAMRAETPPGSVHMLPADALKAPGIRFFGLWSEDEALGMGAWKRLSATGGELKSMHVLHEARGRGLARALLLHLISDARAAGIAQLWLETGSQPGFAPARALYRAHGFEPCAPFADYREDPASVFLTRAI